ncbi:MAG: photosynthesis system II assembly factor Ycf48 [Jaaginema sp. PMC 1079.18]|nr:photosynthesis system II assembly factor Ycf48 [Jaaginema sp. PMC 1080.18]MEC4849710.1 photosynthesis system II assembly factor Ycf48 [Jaaginema sp. PMC 1079.18]MEC4864861.1 photosynthesis system II assembly factor Ycf48 [Jaaginema sp. PMC 1078.18]
MNMNLFVKKLKQILILLVVAGFCASCSSVANLSYNPWQAIALPTEARLLSLDFTDDPNHGWLVGSQSTLFETQDGGETWQERHLDLGEEKLSFTSVSFNGQEGWIVGEPSVLLHTEDGGKSWSRITLSAKLPGAPQAILALGPHSAEMTTNVGAIYKTTDNAKTWSALVEGAVGVVRNIARSQDGEYVAVSSRGNFYSTWKPGDRTWTPHERTSSRRLQNMGFGQDGRRWLIARGGQVQFSLPDDPEAEWDDILYPEPSTSWGLLDVAYRTPEEIWVSGGSGNLLVSFDGGTTWEKDRDIEDVPSNLYDIIFTQDNKGFVLGDRGYLLKYKPDMVASQAT